MPHLCVIPARLGSTRLPSKALRLLAGEALIRVVARRIRDLDVVQRVVVATDDSAIVEAVEGIGIEAVMTSRSHRNGTERVAEVVRMPQFREAQVVINVQGDEPFLPREAITGAVGRVEAGDPIGTAAGGLSPDGVTDPNVVKVVVDQHGHAMRFTREMPASFGWACKPNVYHHFGVYAYRRAALLQWAGLPVHDREVEERLEQLRPMAHGYRIGVAVSHSVAIAGIDTEEDLQRAQTVASRLAERVS